MNLNPFAWLAARRAEKEAEAAALKARLERHVPELVKAGAARLTPLSSPGLTAQRVVEAERLRAGDDR